MALGPFELEGHLGRGAMGEVWRARHRSSGVPAAIKVITDQYASREDYRRRFRDEIRSAAALNHPGIVRVYDYGEVDEEAAAASGLAMPPGTPYLAMELADGGSVDALASELGWRDLRGLLIGLLEALAHAHARGVIHRDLKPGNVLLGTDARGRDRYKISDFGLAFEHREDFDGDDSLESAVGTPHFMAPEQIRRRRRQFGPWTDLYSLGCMAWKLATGKPPYRGDAMLEVAQSHLTEPLPAFEPRFDVPDGFEHWLARLLETHPEERFRRAPDALWALLELPESLAEPSTPGSRHEGAPVDRTTVTEPLEALADEGMPDEGRPTEAPEILEPLTPEHAEDPPRTAEPVDRALPPVPAEWRKRRAPGTSLPRMTAGRELFSLREIPAVGRDEERDALWEALREVVEEQSPKLVLVRGDAGVGKTRLARWLRERAEEVGAARALVAPHDPEARDDGLSAMLASAISLRGLGREEAVERAEQWFAARGIDHPHRARATVEYALGPSDGGGAPHGHLPDAGDLEDAPPDVDPASRDAASEVDSEIEETDQPTDFSNVHETRALVRRFLEAAAAERPIVVHLDDLQWGLETLRFLESLLDGDRDQNLPVLFVATLRDDALAERPFEREIVENLEGFPDTETLRVGPMSQTGLRTLIERLLHLAPAAAECVVDRAGGNPLFAVELVRDWIERGILEPTDRGFAVTDERDPRMPDGLFEVWTERLSELSGEAGETQCAGMQIGAVLGEEIDEAEWRAACEAADLPFPEGFIERLVRRNLLRETDDGWRLAHSLLRETFVRRAKEQGHWKAFNRACTEVVAGEDVALRDAERLARFLLESGDRRRAVEYLVDAGLERSYRMQKTRASELFRRAREAADSTDAEDDPALAARLHLLRGRVALNDELDPDAADGAFERAAECAATAGDDRLRARALGARSSAADARSEFDRAIEWAERAAEVAPDLDSFEGFRAAYMRGAAAMTSGRHEMADRAFRNALKRAPKDYPVARIKTLLTWSVSLKSRSDLEAGRMKLRRGLEEARRNGHRFLSARLCNLLGDIWQMQEEIERARNWYRRAERYAELVDDPRLFACFLGRPHLDITDGNYEAGRRRLVSLQRRTAGRGNFWFDSALLALRARAECGAGEWARARETADALHEILDRRVPAFQLPAESLEEAARKCAEAGRNELAANLARAASAIWSKRGSDRGDELLEELGEERVSARN